jgi:hypothetical protein
MTVSVLKRRLKTLAQIREELEQRKVTAKVRKVEREERQAQAAHFGVSRYVLEATMRGPLVLPLAATYTRDEAFERNRNIFYYLMAHEYGFERWGFKEPEIKTAEAGYGERGREIRPLGRETAVNLNVGAAPLEWLVSKGKLETRLDPPGSGMVRFAAALRFRSEVEGAATSGLKGQAYEGGIGGGGGGRTPSDYAIDCMRTVTAVRESMHPGLHRLLVWVVCDDVWAWEQVKPGKRHRMLNRALKKARTRKGKDKVAALIAKEEQREQRELILKLHKAIDKAAIALGYMSKGEFKQRWERRPKNAASAEKPPAP